MTKQSHEPIFTRDHQLQELLQLSEVVAKSKASILIQGEAGTGKRSLAKYIFEKSQRVHLGSEVFDCTRLALGDQESVFNQILKNSIGKTCMIIEISKLSSQLQGKLFQVMNDGTDIRFIATSTKNLAELVKQGDFREDLFYRISVVNFKIPNLKSRFSDVELLANEFMKKCAKMHDKNITKISNEALQVLNAQTWPGNVRELLSVMERAVLLATQPEIRVRDLQLNSTPVVAQVTSGQIAVVSGWKPGSTLDQIERKVILEALKHHDGNRTHTAKALGISIRTLRNKLAEYRVMGIHA